MDHKVVLDVMAIIEVIKMEHKVISIKKKKNYLQWSSKL